MSFLNKLSANALSTILNYCDNDVILCISHVIDINKKDIFINKEIVLDKNDQLKRFNKHCNISFVANRDFVKLNQDDIDKIKKLIMNDYIDLDKLDKNTFRNIKSLNLSYNNCTDDTLKKFNFNNLKEIFLTGCSNIDDISFIKGTNIKLISIAHTSIKHDKYKELIDEYKNVEIISTYWHENDDDDDKLDVINVPINNYGHYVNLPYNQYSVTDQYVIYPQQNNNNNNIIIDQYPNNDYYIYGGTGGLRYAT